MANKNNRRPITLDNLTRRQAGVINKGNRKVSGNINSLMDNLNNITYGTSRADKADDLMDEFNTLLKGEVESISKSTDGDTTSFITKLFSENNKRLASGMKELEDLFNVNEEQIEAFINEQYRNRLIKQADLREVSSQLIELEEAIIITRDAIISADVVSGHMTRTISIDNDDMEEDQEDYIPIIERMEKKFKLQEKIKNFIIPRSLEFGEYFVYCIPYSKIFEDFSREKNNGIRSQYSPFTEEALNGITLYEYLENRQPEMTHLVEQVTESVGETEIFKEAKKDRNDKALNKEVQEELNQYLHSISINNNSVPLPFLEEGINSITEYYENFKDRFVFETDTNNESEYTFNHVMKGIDSGIHQVSNSKSKKKDKGENFSSIKDCYIKLMDPMHLLPIEIMNETIGYYYIQEEDITPLAGILTSTMYYDRSDMNRTQNRVLNSLAETIVDAFDKKFLEKNEKFKNLIVEALNYYKLNNKKVKFQFIPKEYIVPFKINEDEDGHGVSIIEKSLFYAKLYLMILLFKIMSIITNSNDTKVNYIRQSGIEKNVSNKIQEIARKKQQRQITLADMFSYTTLINKVGQGSEMYVPVGKSNERGIETEILAGQDVQLNSDLLEMLKKAYISGTGVPDVLMNYFNEADFAKTLELANNRFQGRVVSFQLDYNTQITALYKIIAKYSTTIPDEVVESLEFNFVQPKSSNANITNDLINNHNSLSEFLTNIYYGDENTDPKIQKFKKALAKERLPMLDFDNIERIYKESMIDGTHDALNPDNNNEEEV